MNRHKAYTGAVLAAILSFSLGSAAQADGVDVTIGKLLELTGPLSENGPSQDKAVHIAIDYANQAAAAALSLIHI